MSIDTRKINTYFKTALRSDIEQAKEKIFLSDRQNEIFEMFYIKRLPIGFIADTLCVCPMVVNNELRIIREKLLRVI